jgi:hypothetical protein
MNRIYDRIGAAAGAFFVLGIMVGGGMEMSGRTGAADGPGMLANLQRDSTVVNTVGFAVAIAAFVAFLVFLGYLHRVLRRAEGPDGWLATVSVGAGLLYLAIKVGSAAPLMAGFHRRDELTPDLARTLVDLNDAAFVVSGLMFGLFTAAAAAVCLVHRVLPRWVGWFGLVSGVLATVAGVVGIVDMQNYFPVPFLAGTLWVLIASVLLAARRDRRTSPSDVAAGQAARAGAAS